MGFSSIPAYLDPSNWQQEPNPQYGCGGGTGNPQFPNSQLPPPPPPHMGGDGPGSIRPGSMSDRARMANLPMPEAALKCPRCESTNTKFCYFNNYNLAQPRHFCKTCRRYWTRGGALRNVPVGGGCRRNKRSKGSSSKSPAGGDHQNNSGSSSSAISSNSTVGTANILGLLTPQMPFMAPLSTQLSSYGDMNFQLASCSLGGGGGGGAEQWRWQPPQISSLGGLDLPAGIYPFQGGGVEASGYGGPGGGQVRPRLSASGLLTQLASSVKMEGNNQELNLSKQFLGVQGNNDNQYWSGASTTATAWTDLSGFTSSSTSNPI